MVPVPSVPAFVPCPFGLSDFFGTPASGYFKTQRPFTFINGTKYVTNCFINMTATGCFGSSAAPMEPDNDSTY